MPECHGTGQIVKGNLGEIIEGSQDNLMKESREKIMKESLINKWILGRISSGNLLEISEGIPAVIPKGTADILEDVGMLENTPDWMPEHNPEETTEAINEGNSVEIYNEIADKNHG